MIGSDIGRVVHHEVEAAGRGHLSEQDPEANHGTLRTQGLCGGRALLPLFVSRFLTSLMPFWLQGQVDHLRFARAVDGWIGHERPIRIRGCGRRRLVAIG